MTLFESFARVSAELAFRFILGRFLGSKGSGKIRSARILLNLQSYNVHEQFSEVEEASEDHAFPANYIFSSEYK